MHAIIIFFCMIVLVPLMWVILMSVKSLRDAYTGTLWPEQFDFTHYSYVFQKMPSVLHNFSNSIIVTLSTVVVTTVIAILAGYALAHLRLPGAAVVGLILIATLFFPTRLVSIIGVYQLERNLGLINTLPGVILPYISLSLAFSIIIMRGIFLQVSPEMVDAARVDGASSWRTLIQIMLPLAANGIVVVGDRQFRGGVGGVSCTPSPCSATATCSPSRWCWRRPSAGSASGPTHAWPRCTSWPSSRASWPSRSCSAGT